MVNATELRIGNWLWWNPFPASQNTTLPPIKVEVASLAANSIGYFSPNLEHRAEPFEDDLLQTQTPHRPLEEFAPIELTAEWLQKLSLEKTEAWRLSLLQQPDGYEVQSVGENLSHIRYLHQLQNLYFILTGEELEISQ